jgi:hypothetical protein
MQWFYYGAVAPRARFLASRNTRAANPGAVSTGGHAGRRVIEVPAAEADQPPIALDGIATPIVFSCGRVGSVKAACQPGRSPGRRRGGPCRPR